MSNPRQAPPIQVLNGRPYMAAAAFVRPANTTQYAANELVANSATAGSVTPMTFAIGELGQNRPIVFTQARIWKTNATLTSANFRLHLFKTIPTVTGGDNAAFSIATQADTWIGSLSGLMAGPVAVLPAINAGIGMLSPDGGVAALETVLGSGESSIYGLLETLATYTPTSAETFTINLMARTL